MRYITNDKSYVLAVSFGCEMSFADCDCTEYTGKIPSGWDSLEEWYEDEGDKLWRWKIVSGNLTLDSTATAPEEGRWGEPKLQDKTVSGLFLTKTIVQADEDYDGLEKVTIEAQRLQNKTVSGPFVTQTTVQADSNYDALGSVSIPAQPCWVEVDESKVYTMGGYSLYVPLPVAGSLPEKVFITFTSDPNLFSSNQVAMAYIDLNSNQVSFLASAGDGTFYYSLNASYLELGLFNSDKDLSVGILSGRGFYYQGTSMQTFYKCYLMY